MRFSIKPLSSALIATAALTLLVPGAAQAQRNDRDRDRDQGRDYDRGRGGGRNVELGLMCFGEGEKPAMATSYGWTWNSRRDRYESSTRTELTSREFDASLMVQIWPGGGRIRLPKRMVPTINSRGENGWWDLRDVVMTRNTITANYRLNGLNKPKVTIDRRSGRITIRGLSNYGFRGMCDMIDGRDHRRF